MGVVMGRKTTELLLERIEWLAKTKEGQRLAYLRLCDEQAELKAKLENYEMQIRELQNNQTVQRVS